MGAGGRDNISVVVADAITEEEANRRAAELKALTATESHQIVEDANEYTVTHTATPDDPQIVSERELSHEQ